MSITGKVLLDNVDQNQEQWLRLRAGKVSSSNIAVIAGLSQWKSKLELWAEWTGKVKDTFTGNAYTKLGQLLEPFVAELYTERTGKKVKRANALYQHPAYEWAIATPDYLSEDDTEVVEIKTGTSRQLQKWILGNVDEYVAQNQWQMGVLGIQRGVLVPFLGLDIEEVRDIHIEFDAELFSMFFDLATEFLNCVRRDVPPNAGPGDAGLITQIINRKKGQQKLLVDKEAERAALIIANLEAISEQKKTPKEQLDELEDMRKMFENELKLLLGEASIGVLPDGREIKVSKTCVPESVRAAYEFERVYLPKRGKDGK